MADSSTPKSPLPLVAVVGPTASGKTALSLGLARRLRGEIVSADSMQIYRGMDIQTAKPSKAEMGEIPHHLIGVLGTEESCSVAQYQALAKAAIADIHARGRLPLLVGGTGLYVGAVVDNTLFGEMEFDPALRARLTRELETLGGEPMLERLRVIDPAAAQKLHPNNTHRIIRALEVYETTGKTLSAFWAQSHEKPSPYQTIMLGVTFRDRARLYERIDRRVEEMLENGLLEEVCALRTQTLSATARQAIGCKELAGWFGGVLSLPEAVENLKRQTRRYAKRQLTWFGRDERVQWLYQEDGDTLDKAVRLIADMLQALDHRA